jgi:hypothetical protein
MNLWQYMQLCRYESMICFPQTKTCITRVGKNPWSQCDLTCDTTSWPIKPQASSHGPQGEFVEWYSQLFLSQPVQPFFFVIRLLYLSKCHVLNYAFMVRTWTLLFFFFFFFFMWIDWRWPCLMCLHVAVWTDEPVIFLSTNLSGHGWCESSTLRIVACVLHSSMGLSRDWILNFFWQK